MRRVLLIGSGAREHALGWKLAAEGWSVTSAPGNPGMAAVGACVPLKTTDIEGICAYAAEQRFDLVVVGPEAPLTLGLADALTQRGIAVFGPTAAAARIEGSKIFAKRLMQRKAVPTARFAEFSDAKPALDFLASPDFGYPLVVKADGLAAGKGVVVTDEPATARAAVEAMMVDGRFGDAGRSIIIEECLSGTEISFFALAYGRGAVAVGSAQDYKRLMDDDRGPNTGGMGSLSPSPLVSSELGDLVIRTIVAPTLEGLAEEGCEFRGLLYAGLMLTKDGPKVLEFNCRFGDPETQPLMLTLGDGLGTALQAVASGLRPAPPERLPGRHAVCVVLASEGYPEAPVTGKMITGTEKAGAQGAVVFHAGTASRDGGTVTSGGRVLSVCASGGSCDEARRVAYAAAGLIAFDGMQYRRDIATIGKR